VIINVSRVSNALNVVRSGKYRTKRMKKKIIFEFYYEISILNFFIISDKIKFLTLEMVHIAPVGFLLGIIKNIK
jgi:hypothetical protein